VLKLNPRSTLALVRLAELNCFTFAKPERGLEYARQAWNISQDPAVAVTLGPIGSVAGDFKWASPILSQARRAQPNDNRLAFYEAITTYGLGNISQARVTFAEIQSSDSTGALAKDALLLLDYQLNAGDPTAAASAAQAALQIDPKFAPAIIANGFI